jgi:DNA-binding NarL/FixJ family response regulator
VSRDGWSDPERLRAAHEAYKRRDWAAAYRGYGDLYGTVSLTGEELYLFAHAAWWLGHIREMLRLCEESHATFLAEGRVERAAMVALETAFQWFLCGKPELGSGWLSRARRLLESLPQCLGHAWLVELEANERAAAGDIEGALAGARRLQDFAVQLDEPALTSFGLALEGRLMVRRGDVERGFGLLDEAMLAVLAGRIAPAEAGNLYCQMMSICHDVADFRRAQHWTEIVERWCDGLSGAPMFLGICRVHQSQLLRMRGEWTTAAELAAAAARDLAELNVEAAAEAQYEMAQCHRLRGSWDKARACYDAAAALGRSPHPGLALLELAQGRKEQAHEALSRCLAAEADPFRRARLLVAQVEVACRRGDDDTAAAAAAAMEDIAGTYSTDGFRAWAAQVRGMVLICSGQSREAVAPLRSALATSTALGSRFEAANLHSLLGRALATIGDESAAQAQLEAARSAYAELGVAPVVPWLADTPAESAPGGLTTREAEVLGAIADGLTNRQVAAHLVISEKTVARHLANVYTKLGVANRTAAAAWAHQHPVTGRNPADA